MIKSSGVTGLFEHKIELLHRSPMEGVGLKDELVANGLYLDVDFSWSYYAATYDNDGFSAVTPRSIVFAFKDPALATFYQLKWA